jgi:hypothetical protein
VDPSRDFETDELHGDQVDQDRLRWQQQDVVAGAREVLGPILPDGGGDRFDRLQPGAPS